MVKPKLILIVKPSTKAQFLRIQDQLKNNYPDYKINQDYVLRKLIEIYVGATK